MTKLSAKDVFPTFLLTTLASQGNKLGVNLPNLQPGIITSVTPETILAFEDVIFRNNDYGDPALQVCELRKSGMLSILYSTLTIP